MGIADRLKALDRLIRDEGKFNDHMAALRRIEEGDMATMADQTTIDNAAKHGICVADVSKWERWAILLALANAAFAVARADRPISIIHPANDEAADALWERECAPYEHEFELWSGLLPTQAEQASSLTLLRQRYTLRQKARRIVERIYGAGCAAPVKVFGEGWADHGVVELGA